MIKIPILQRGLRQNSRNRSAIGLIIIYTFYILIFSLLCYKINHTLAPQGILSKYIALRLLNRKLIIEAMIIYFLSPLLAILIAERETLQKRELWNFTSISPFRFYIEKCFLALTPSLILLILSSIILFFSMLDKILLYHFIYSQLFLLSLIILLNTFQIAYYYLGFQRFIILIVSYVLQILALINLLLFNSLADYINSHPTLEYILLLTNPAIGLARSVNWDILRWGIFYKHLLWGGLHFKYPIKEHFIYLNLIISFLLSILTLIIYKIKNKNFIKYIKPESSISIIKLENITLVDRKKIILKDISFSIPSNKSKIWGLIGDSGSGKSYFLRFLAGLEKQKQGNITYFSHSSQTKPIISYIPMYEKFYDKLKVREFLESFSLNISNEELDSILVLVKLENEKETFIKNLLAQKRIHLSLARALLNKPNWLFIDEPYFKQDTQTRYELSLILQNIANKLNCNIIIASHFEEELKKLTNNILVISQKIGIRN